MVGSDDEADIRLRHPTVSRRHALLVVDGTKGATHQEQRLAEEIRDAGTGLVVLLNKWDVISDDERARIVRSDQ